MLNKLAVTVITVMTAMLNVADVCAWEHRCGTRPAWRTIMKVHTVWVSSCWDMQVSH